MIILNGSSIGEEANDIVLSQGDSLSVQEGGIATGAILNEAALVVSSGGTATNTTVNQYGDLNVSNGGTASDTVVNSGGYLTVYEGGFAESTTLNDGGRAWIFGGGGMEGISVSSGGSLHIDEDGFAVGVSIAEGGAMDIAITPGTHVEGDYAGSSFWIGDANISDFAISAGTISLLSGAMAENITVNKGGELDVMDNSTAVQVIENGGYVFISDGSEVSFASNSFSNQVLEKGSATVHSGTTAASTTLNSRGTLEVYEGGIAGGVTVNKGGILEIYSGGTATQVLENGGYAWVNEGAQATFTPNALNGLVLGREESLEEPLEIELGESGGYVEDETYEQKATLHSGTTATSTTLHNGGWLLVCDGGIANDTTVNYGGEIDVYDGGTANGITANRDCWIVLRDGATISGQIDLHGSAELIVKGAVLAEEASITLHVDTRTTSDPFFIYLYDESWDDYDGIGVFEGGTFAITVADSQDCGTYNIATGAYDFNVSFSLQNTDSEGIGLLAAGEDSLVYNNLIYTLNLIDGEITLTVEQGEEDTVPPVISNIVADVTGPTNATVTVTAEASDDSGVVTLYYSKDCGDFTAYGDGVEFAANGSVVFKAVDAAGNETTSEVFAVTNIDTTAPVISHLAADVTAPTNATVTVTAEASDNANHDTL